MDRLATASVVELDTHGDARGRLSVADGLPFPAARLFVVDGVPDAAVRGGHAQRRGEELLVCVRGACTVDVDDGERRWSVRLDRPGLGLHLPPLVWSAQRDFTADAVLVVLASNPYDPDDHIDLDEVRRARR